MERSCPAVRRRGLLAEAAADTLEPEVEVDYAETKSRRALRIPTALHGPTRLNHLGQMACRASTPETRPTWWAHAFATAA